MRGSCIFFVSYFYLTSIVSFHRKIIYIFWVTITFPPLLTLSHSYSDQSPFPTPSTTLQAGTRLEGLKRKSRLVVAVSLYPYRITRRSNPPGCLVGVKVKLESFRGEVTIAFGRSIIGLPHTTTKPIHLSPPYGISTTGYYTSPGAAGFFWGSLS